LGFCFDALDSCFLLFLEALAGIVSFLFTVIAGHSEAGKWFSCPHRLHWSVVPFCCNGWFRLAPTFLTTCRESLSITLLRATASSFFLAISKIWSSVLSFCKHFSEGCHLAYCWWSGFWSFSPPTNL
jgi:hypothetical protein